MADGYIRSDAQCISLVSHVEDAVVLDVRPLSDSNIVHVATHNRIEPDTAIFPDFHIADDSSALCDKNRFVKFGADASIWND